MMADKTVYLRVAPGEGNDKTLKINWFYEGWDPVYLISREDVESVGARIREHLDNLVDATMHGRKVKEVGDILTNIANAGSDLYFHLFEGAGRTASVARDVKKWFESLVGIQPLGGMMIRVIVDATIHVPWGLIFYPELTESQKGSSSFASYENFWTIRHSVATVYSQIDPPLARPMLADTTTFLAVLNKEVLLRLGGDVSEEWCWGSEIKCSDDFFRILQEFGQRSHVMYFYCHANGEALELQSHPEDVINLELFRARIARRKSDYPAIVFLNGCATATGHKSRGWIDVTWKHGLQGFIGTETKIPELFAWRFGIDFLRQFLQEGVSVRQILCGLRRKHWPLSLLYGAYCFPELSILGPVAAAKPGTLYGNLSEMELGKDVLR